MIVRLLLMFALLLLSTSALPAVEPVKKVMILGIDGCRYDTIEAAATPHLHALIAAGAVATNTTIIAPRAVKSDTISGPGWSSILTGVWSDKHLVVDNRFTERGYDQYPHLFRRLKAAQQQRMTVSLDGWGQIQKHIVTSADIAEDCHAKAGGDYAQADRYTLQRTQELLRDAQPDAMFVYFGNVDETGHKHGFHPSVKEYVAELELVDSYIGAIVKEVNHRPTIKQEDWLYIVCTDHGGQGKDHGKGHNIPVINTVFLIVSGPSAMRGKIEQPTGLVDVVPTALTHLGVTIDPAWQLDGRAVGLKPKIEVRKTD